jgi:hypothetical protein
MAKNKFIFLVGVIATMTLTAIIVSALTWTGPSQNVNIFRGEENIFYQFNVSNYTTDIKENLSIAIDTTLNNITWFNGTETKKYLSLNSLPWITYNQSNFILNINVTNNNQTGNFTIPFQAKDNETVGITGLFHFTINATNDAPRFTSFQTEYNLTREQNFNEIIQGWDEESHYPLKFNLYFLDNCTRTENCNLLNLTSISNTSARLNLTPTEQDIGYYWAHLNITDAGENFKCPHIYCDNSTYEQNQTSQNYTIRFNVFDTLRINVTNCTGISVTEGDNIRCNITIKTKEDLANLSIITTASYRNHPATTPHNASWFYESRQIISSGFSETIEINITPLKRQVGNWSINFNVTDTISSQNNNATILIFVNYSESTVSLDSISDKTIRRNESFTITAYDEDLLIKDESVRKENLTFASNTSWVRFTNIGPNHEQNFITPLVWLNFDKVLSENGVGNYSVSINVSDKYGNNDTKNFIIQVLNDTAPKWNSSYYSNLSTLGDQIIIDLKDYVIYDGGENLTFSYTNNTRFDGFNITSNGIINFTSSKVDIGQQILNLTVSIFEGGLTDTTAFNFTILNINSPPTINELQNAGNVTILNWPARNVKIEEKKIVSFYLLIADEDFLIPEQQSNFYKENMTINISFKNLTNVETIPELSFKQESLIGDIGLYTANFTLNKSHIGYYNVTINVTDASNKSAVEYFTLMIDRITELIPIENQSTTIYENFTLNISADDYTNELIFELENMTVNGNFLEINSSTGIINLQLNESFEGTWHYNASIKNNESVLLDWQVFTIYIYGLSNITFPEEYTIFNLVENSSSILNFSLNHTIGDNLTIEIYNQNITCSYNNSSDCNYSEMGITYMLENPIGWLNWSFAPKFWDETYGNLKNITLIVYPSTPNLTLEQKQNISSNFTFTLNITHANAPIEFINDIESPLRNSTLKTMTINLSEHFRDIDALDLFYNQNINFTIKSNLSESKIKINNNSIINGSYSFSINNNDYIINLNGEKTLELLNITGYDLSDENLTITNATSNDFIVEFFDPESTETPTPTPTPTPSPSPSGTGGSSQTTTIKLFSLRIIVPRDIILTDENYIEVPFALQNSGQIDILGINVSNLVLFNNEFSEDIRIVMEPTYIDKLSIGESKEFNLKISADTTKSGRYKVTIFADVLSPKFSDWGDFFIELKRINDTMAEHIIIFTEKLIADNPECLELKEVFNEAKKKFAEEDYIAAARIAQEVATACERAIRSNEQIRTKRGEFLKNSIFYLSISILAIFIIGFIFYIYKRRRFNKYKFVEIR